jgi:DNA-binding NarL/FixJ family response regulator
MSSKSKSEIKVAVVEDNAQLSRNIKEILDGAEGMRCVATCTSAEQALAVLPALNPMVVLLDINLPGMSGVECIPKLLELLPKALVVMVTIQSNITAIFQSMQAGAVGYLHKPVDADELIAAIHEVVDGGSPMTMGIARQVVKAFKTIPPADPLAEEGDLADLSPREHDILRMLAGGGLYKEIAEELGVSWHTVHNHIRRIYKKLHVRSRSQAINKFLTTK